MIIKNIPTAQKTPLSIPVTQGVLESFHPIGFMGYRLDKPSGCYILGNGYRMYNPIMRAFYSPDSESPFGAGGLSRYAYCRFDPVNFSDPGGHMSEGAQISLGVGIFLALLGIGMSIFTMGSSLSLLAAGGTLSAGAVASTALVVTSSVLGIASGATSIASLALGESNPEVSQKLAWASLGMGIGSAFTGLIGGRLAMETIRLPAGAIAPHSKRFGASVIGMTFGAGLSVGGEVADNNTLRIMGGLMMGASGLAGATTLRTKPYSSAIPGFVADTLADPGYSNNYRSVSYASNSQQVYINTVDREIAKTLTKWKA
ncbi:RHS repeat-associated core domain-containing protein [Enterobacter asburiae]